MLDLSFRPIRPEDDAAVASVIRTVMPEFGADGPGFAIHDPEVDHMAEAYAASGAAFFVVVDGADRILGGGGFARLDGAEEGTCELRKMYFLKEARGTGTGERLLRHILEAARQAGYRTMYLETLTGMDAAMKLYAKLGFKPLCAPMGATGHTSCDRWYAMELIDRGLIRIDWSLISVESDLWNTLFRESQAPEWHGRNLNALNDSWVTGDINPSGPPYRFQFTSCDQIEPRIAQFARGVMEIATLSVKENGGSYSAT